MSEKKKNADNEIKKKSLCEARNSIICPQGHLKDENKPFRCYIRRGGGEKKKEEIDKLRLWHNHLYLLIN